MWADRVVQVCVLGEQADSHGPRLSRTELCSRMTHASLSIPSLTLLSFHTLPYPPNFFTGLVGASEALAAAELFSHNSPSSFRHRLHSCLHHRIGGGASEALAAAEVARAEAAARVMELESELDQRRRAHSSDVRSLQGGWRDGRGGVETG